MYFLKIPVVRWHFRYLENINVICLGRSVFSFLFLVPNRVSPWNGEGSFSCSFNGHIRLDAVPHIRHVISDFMLIICGCVPVREREITPSRYQFQKFIISLSAFIRINPDNHFNPLENWWWSCYWGLWLVMDDKVTAFMLIGMCRRKWSSMSEAIELYIGVGYLLYSRIKRGGESLAKSLHWGV